MKNYFGTRTPREELDALINSRLAQPDVVYYIAIFIARLVVMIYEMLDENLE